MDAVLLNYRFKPTVSMEKKGYDKDFEQVVMTIKNLSGFHFTGVLLVFNIWLSSENLGLGILAFPIVLMVFTYFIISKFFPLSKKAFERSMVYCVGLMLSINPWFWVVSIWFVLAGIVKIIRSKLSFLIKLKMIIIPLLMWGVLFLSFYTQCMLTKFY